MFFSLMSCGRKASTVSENKNPAESAVAAAKADSFTDVTRKTRVLDVINDPVFGDYGRLIFPVDRPLREDLTLEDMDEVLMWYNDIKPDKTVEIVNYLGQQAAAGTQVFYDIYTEEEK